MEEEKVEVKQEVQMEEDSVVIDRNPVPLAFCAIPAHHQPPPTPSSTDLPTPLTDILELIDSSVDRNNMEVRKAASVKSYGCDTESEFEFSGDDSDFGDDFRNLKENAKDSDEEFDRLVKYSSKIIEKIHKSEYPEAMPPTMKKTRKSGKAQKTKNVHDYDNLPPLENLSLECKSSLIEFGHVTKVVDCIVVIEPTSTEVLDFDSVLFDQDSKSIGKVFDIFGQVKSPSYSVRFNSSEEASMIPIGMKVYYAPNEEELTKMPFKGLNLAAANRETINKLNRKMDQQEAMAKQAAHIPEVDSDVEFSDDEAEKAYSQNKQRSNNTTNRRMPRNRGKFPANVRFNLDDAPPAAQNQQPVHQNFGNWRGGNKRSWNTQRTVKPYRRDFDEPATVPQPTPTTVPPTTVPQPATVVKQEDISDNPYAEFGCFTGMSGRFGF